MASKVACVALPTPLNQLFDYLVKDKVSVGCRVGVFFGKRALVGVVVALKDDSDIAKGKLKTIDKVLDDKAFFDAKMRFFLQWVSRYYHHPIGEVYLTALPKRLRQTAPLKIKAKKPLAHKGGSVTLTVPQQNAVDTISQARGFKALLLHGVTGSGKTEVYLAVIKRVLLAQQQVLVLLPEIGLAPQMVARFQARLKMPVCLYHSQLSENEKANSYLLAKNNQAGVILGTRSAIFIPIKRLALIIIDEEHDDSFKQQSSLRYSAKDLSFVRAKQLNIPLLLGSATPSLAMLKQVQDGKVQRLTLAKRAHKAPQPNINIIDMRSETSPISTLLAEKIKTTLAADKQAMLFINRRGYAPVYFCRQCQWQARCQHCACALVYYRQQHLKCHHCGTTQPLLNQCPSCGENDLIALGQGTQRIEEWLWANFVNVPVIRIDRDSTRRKQQLENSLATINTGKPCIIVGTQMLAKGHHFDKLSLVGVIDADAGLFSVDFRATERLAQLLIQVSGRAGRGDELGQVYIQSQQPQHPLFAFIKQHYYTRYANQLLLERQQVKLPPFSYQALLCANAKNKKNALALLSEVADYIKKNKGQKAVSVFGPVDATIEKKADYFYVYLYFQSEKRSFLHSIIGMAKSVIAVSQHKNKTRWFLDVDPIEG